MLRAPINPARVMSETTQNVTVCQRSRQTSHRTGFMSIKRCRRRERYSAFPNVQRRDQFSAATEERLAFTCQVRGRQKQLRASINQPRHWFTNSDSQNNVRPNELAVMNK